MNKKYSEIKDEFSSSFDYTYQQYLKEKDNIDIDLSTRELLEVIALYALEEAFPLSDKQIAAYEKIKQFI